MNLKKRKLHSINGNYSISVAGHSRSSEATYFFLPEMRIKFDCGGQVKNFDNQVRYTFLTHGHGDHSIYLMCTQKAYQTVLSQLYVPFELREFVFNYIRVFQELNDSSNIDHEEYAKFSSKHYELKAVKPRDKFIIQKGKYKVVVYDCFHTVPCRGYGIIEKRRKLKPEYSNLTGKEIGELKKNGVEITYDLGIPRVLFLGDTSIEFFEKNGDVLKMGYSFIFVECTFLGKGDSDIARKRGHIHWNELKKHVESCPNTIFILIHFSMKYSCEFIEEFFKKEDLKNVIPWMN